MNNNKKIVSIGIFAHNEAENITQTLDSLIEQDIFEDANSKELDIHVSVIANGCTDATVDISKGYLREKHKVSSRVIEIEKPGKSNAWNKFIHSPDSQHVDYFVCMDSDITFGSYDLISSLIEALFVSDEAYLSVDVAQKDNNKRILVVDNVCHYFTPDPSIKSLFRHEERLLIGTFVNSVIYGYLWKEVESSGIDEGSLVAKNNQDNPKWVEGLINKYREPHDTIIPKHFYRKCWKQWKKFSITKKVITFPIISVASIVKFFLLKKVERRLVNESGLGVW